MQIKLEDIIAWGWRDQFSNPEIKKRLLQFGGTFAIEDKSINFAANFNDTKNFYNIETYRTGQNLKENYYMDERRTSRKPFPDGSDSYIYNHLYADESSPVALTYTKKYAAKLGYSSYRSTLFTIELKNSDLNLRLPILPPTFTLEGLQKVFGENFYAVWFNVVYNFYLCVPYFTKLDPLKDYRELSFYPVIPIGNYHLKSMVEFCEKYDKKFFVYGANYNFPEKKVIAGYDKIIDFIKNR